MMKRRLILLIVLLALPAFLFGVRKPLYRNPDAPVEKRVKDLLGRMTLDEKIAQMQHVHAHHYDNWGRADIQKLLNNTGYMSRGCMEAFPYSLQQYVDAVYEIQKGMQENTRLGIPVIPVVEGLHGVVQDGCTIYPQAIAQGATFNPALIEEMAYQIAREARSIGAWQVLSPCLDVARELRWGRVEETFGEDPFKNAVDGTAYVRGAQKGGLIVTPKHFIAHGTPSGGLNLASVAGGKYDLYNVYMTPFKMIIDECSPLSIMNCYSLYDGEAVTGSRSMLTDFLRGKLGFKGYVYSDWGSIDMLRYFHKVAADSPEAAKMAIEAGLDLEASSDTYANIRKMVESGYLDMKYVDQAVSNILYAKFKSGVFDDPLPDKEQWKTTIHNPESIELSRRMAVESAVLLENKTSVLPLDVTRYESIAVIGPNAARVQFGDYSWGTDEGYGVTPLQGIQGLVGDQVKISYVEGCDLWSQNKDGFEEAVEAARNSDIAVMFVGSQSALLARRSEPATSGEGFDLTSLKLPGVQEELVDAVCATGTPVVLVLVTGKPFEMIRIKDKVAALVVQWYAGEKQGEAIADLLFGKENFSGRLPVSFPKSTGALPCFYNHYSSDKGYYNNKGAVDRPGRDYVFADPYALYPFGYGLSYSGFEYRRMDIGTSDGPDRKAAGVLSADDTLRVNVTVRNVSDLTGMETVQIYSSDMASSMATPSRKLVGYSKVEILPGEDKVVELLIPMSRLGFYDNEMNLRVEPGDFRIMACSSADNVHLSEVLTVPGRKGLDSSVQEAGAKHVKPEKGREVKVEFKIRDIQASVLKDVEVVAGGNVLAITDADGACEARIPTGTEVILRKSGYESLKVKIGKAGRQDLTMTPAF